MALTKTTDLSNAVVAKYEKAYYLLAAKEPGIWGQFVQWQDPISAGNGASSYDYSVFGEIDPVEDALTEDADVTPDIITDSNITVTPTEYGKTIARTKKAELQSRVNLASVMGEQISRNRIKSVDRILRRGACGRGSSRPTQTLHIDGSVAMASLTGATTDLITWAFLNELTMHAESMGIEPMDGENFVAVIHPLLEYDLKNLTEWKNVGYYQAKDNIYRGEVGQLGNVRFIKSRMGRVFLGSGAAVQAATTLSAAANKGATTVTVALATGLTAGDYITIGALETESVNPGNNLEQCLITNVASTTLTLRCNGVGGGFGLRFDHAANESVVEAYNVAAIPIIGKNSIVGVYASEAGQYGIPKAKTGLDYLDRFAYLGWWWYGGLGLVQKNIILGKVALAKWTLGMN